VIVKVFFGSFGNSLFKKEKKKKQGEVFTHLNGPLCPSLILHQIGLAFRSKAKIM
jgi:hypothetical protein